jgi:hypothetical protein
VSGWHKIETALKDETPVLLFCAPHYAVGVWVSGHWYDPVCGDGLPFFDDATHWMALPTPPELDAGRHEVGQNSNA